MGTTSKSNFVPYFGAHQAHSSINFLELAISEQAFTKQLIGRMNLRVYKEGKKINKHYKAKFK